MITIVKIIVIETEDDDKEWENILSYLKSYADVVVPNNKPELFIDKKKRKVYIHGKQIVVTQKEFDILLYLSSQPERVFTYQQIYESVWDEPYVYEKNNIMTHISHLKAKIESDPAHPRYIENVRGVGYRFKKQ